MNDRLPAQNVEDDAPMPWYLVYGKGFQVLAEQGDVLWYATNACTCTMHSLRGWLARAGQSCVSDLGAPSHVTYVLICCLNLSPVYRGHVRSAARLIQPRSAIHPQNLYKPELKLGPSPYVERSE